LIDTRVQKRTMWKQYAISGDLFDEENIIKMARRLLRLASIGWHFLSGLLALSGMSLRRALGLCSAVGHLSRLVTTLGLTLAGVLAAEGFVHNQPTGVGLAMKREYNTFSSSTCARTASLRPAAPGLRASLSSSSAPPHTFVIELSTS